MVAISLYRGNLHRVPDVPRRWLMPERTISFKDFRCLLRRRSVALSRHLPSSTSNPSPSQNNPGDASDRPGPSIERSDVGIWREGTSDAIVSEEVNDKVEDPKVLETGEIPKKNVGDSNPVADVTEKESGPVNDTVNIPLEKKPDEPLNVESKTTEKGEVSTEREKRKKEVEEKLQVLTAKKHNLVQVLKQILNAEEELKRRSSTPGTAMRPAVSLQVDVTYDAGSMAIKHPTPKAGIEANQAGDAEGGEADDGSNHNALCQRLPRMSSTSPSPEPAARGKPALSQLNLVTHPARASLAATSTGSSSRFAPQGPSVHPVAVSLSGTNYVVSSPSPAASGGTSIFKDAAR